MKYELKYVDLRKKNKMTNLMRNEIIYNCAI
jgi:hypothetical protein